MKNRIPNLLTAVSLALFLAPAKTLPAEVTHSSGDGFQTVTEQTTKADAKTVYRCLVDDFSKWYDASHSWSGEAKNLSLDLERQCFYEVLPEGGFVRHMEIVFHQPGRKLALSGGLGPLQDMGVSGTLVVQLEQQDEQTVITLTYNVAGSDGQQLDQIAPVVDQVLAGQLVRLQEFCDRNAE